MPRPFGNRGGGALRRQAAAFRNQAVQAGRRARRVPVKGAPDVALEEFDGEEVSLRIRAVPADDDHGGRLSREVLDAVASLRRLSRASGSGGSATPRTTS